MARTSIRKPATSAGSGEEQLTLQPPQPRAYRSSTGPPALPRDLRPWAARLTSAGLGVSAGVLVYIVVFTSPARSANVLAFLAAVGFAAAFGSWSIGYAVRSASARVPSNFPTAPVTRQSLLAAAAMETMAVLALNRLASGGAAILTVLVAIAAELVLRRLSVRL